MRSYKIVRHNDGWVDRKKGKPVGITLWGMDLKEKTIGIGDCIALDSWKFKDGVRYLDVYKIIAMQKHHVGLGKDDYSLYCGLEFVRECREEY